MRRTPLEEQITTFSMEGGKDEVEGYTCEPQWVKRFEKLAQDNPDTVRLVYKDEWGVFCYFPRSYLRTPKAPAKRELTDEQRQVLADRMKQVRATASE